MFDPRHARPAGVPFRWWCVDARSTPKNTRKSQKNLRRPDINTAPARAAAPRRAPLVEKFFYPARPSGICTQIRSWK